MSDARRRQIIKTPQAVEDVIQIFVYISLRNESAGNKFLVESEQAFEQILETPGIGRRWEPAIRGYSGLRVTLVSRRFRNYCIFYRPVAEGIQIVRVLHAARNLGSLLRKAKPGHDPKPGE